MTLSAADFELLLQANRILSSQLDISTVLKSVMELATKVVRAEASSLLLLDEATNELTVDVALGSAKERIKEIRLKLGEGIAGWVAKEKQALIVNDVTKEPRFTGKVDKSTNFVTRSILAVPLLVKGRLIGVVEAINKENKGLFSAHDQEAFEVFGSQAAIAIENARLFSEVLREKETLNTVFAQMSDGLFLLDKQGTILLMNEPGAHFVGIEPNVVRGRNFGPGLFPGFESSPDLSRLTHFTEKITPLELVRREGKDFFVSALVLKTVDGFLVILHDTTEEKRGERLKRNFLSLISHKLKTPLTVIMGYGPALLEQTDNMNPFQKTAIKAVCEKGEQLGQLVDKLLRFTTVESDTLKPQLELWTVRALFQEAEKGADIKVDLDPSITPQLQIAADKMLSIEIFKNLIENAFKFNDKAEKKVVVSAVSQGKFVAISVKDNGVGIPAEEKEKVFQKFYQIENSFTGQVPGAGLGLALCKKAVEAMGGDIHLESELGRGTTVVVQFSAAL